MCKFEFPKEKICAGCGKEHDLEHDSHHIYIVYDKYYCEPCAVRLPKYIMKHCFQCAFYIEADDKKGMCVRRNDHVIGKDDACEEYKSRLSYF